MTDYLQVTTQLSIGPDLGSNCINITDTWLEGPILTIDRGMMCKKDISAYGGALMTCGDPSRNSGCGGGALQMGHAFTDTSDYPAIVLTDAPSSRGGYNTLMLKQGTDNPSLTLMQQWDWANLALGNVYASGAINLYGSALNINNSSGSSNELCLSFDGSNANLVVNHSTASLFLTANTGSVVLNAASNGYIYIWHNTPLVPYNSGTGAVGDPNTRYFDTFAAVNYYGDNSYYLDNYDDLALVKQWGEPEPKLPEDYDPTKTVPPQGDIFKILRTDNEGKVPENKKMYHYGRLHNFALGCAKALAKKQDKHDAILIKLLNQIETLQTEIDSLKKAA
jgi:hypothetical protein